MGPPSLVTAGNGPPPLAPGARGLRVSSVSPASGAGSPPGDHGVIYPAAAAPRGARGTHGLVGPRGVLSRFPLGGSAIGLLGVGVGCGSPQLRGALGAGPPRGLGNINEPRRGGSPVRGVPAGRGLGSGAIGGSVVVAGCGDVVSEGAGGVSPGRWISLC